MVKKKRIVSKLILALVVLTAVSFCFLGSTFARYTSGGESTASVSVAEWNVSFEGDGVSTITFSQLSPAKDAWASETDGEERTHSTGSVKAITITNSGDVAADVTVTVGTLTVTTDGTSYDGTYFDGVSEGENPAQAEVEGLFSVGFGYATTADADAATSSAADGTITQTLAANGAITGTPDKECRDYAFTVTASALGYSDTECTFTISVLYPLEYKAAALEDGSYGKPYLAAINTADCDAPVTYALKDGSTLPKGLKLSSGGYIVGIPEEACSSTFTVIASSAYAAPVEAEYTLKINPTFDSATKLPYGKAGEAYVGSVATAQGSFDIKYSLVSGALPEGLTLSEDGSRLHLLRSTGDSDDE